jgi:deoxyribonucleoside regulator
MDEQKVLLTKIAWLYYMNDCTQQEIADRMNLSRTKITRYLKKAKELGIVKVSVSMDQGCCFDKEEKLKRLLRINDVTVVPSIKSGEESENGLGIAGAARMNQILTANDVVGVAWGHSLYSVAKNLEPVRRTEGKQIEVIQLMGGMTISDRINPEEVVKMIASRLQAQAYLLNVPAIVSSKEAKDILMNDEKIARVFKKTQTCTVCMLGLGDLSKTSSLYETGSFSDSELNELKEAGAVGDILSRAYDLNGVPVHTSVTDRIIAVELDEIKQIKKRIAFAIGVNKVKPIIGATRGGYLSELITDENTADSIIEFLQG